MTNKNKNIKTLVKRASPVSSTPFEIIPTLTERVELDDFVAEAAENTSGIEHERDERKQPSVTALTAEIEGQASRVQELEYQLEHALSRRRGLEKELEVREEITESVNEDVQKARTQLRVAASELESLHLSYQALQQAHAETDVLARELGEQVARHHSDAAAKERQLDGLRQELASSRAELLDLRAYVDGRREDWAAQERTVAELQRAVEELTRKRESLSELLAARDAGLRDARELLDEARSAAADRQGALQHLEEENRELRELLHGDPEQERSRYRDRIAFQAGELAARAQELETLRKDNARLEEYANSLRMGLQDRAAESQESLASRRQLEGSIDAAAKTIDELTAKLDRARTDAETLADEKERLKADFEREMRQVRFELGNAYSTIADQASVNEQLESDLLDNQEFRQALETRLGDLDKKRRKEIEALTRQLEDAREAAASYERKIRIKDGAISDLMKELADRHGSTEISHDLENALRKIDGFRPEQRKVRRKGERDYRVARMLVGEADGKELRFPLFRDRLTIGRTPHNDIQLNMRFISRRHAVIATDNNKTRIIDWGSRNGVYVNGKRVTEKILESGDMITIGVTHLRFQESAKS